MFSLGFRVHSEAGRVRRNNQDTAFVSPNLLVIADDMGDVAAGDLASAVAAGETSEGDRHLNNGYLVEYMAGTVQRTNDRLTNLIEDNLELGGMDTTFSGTAFPDTMLGVAHIGDPRDYLLHKGELKQFTHDYSWAQSLIDESRITPGQAATHPHRSLILKVLNGAGDTDPDFFELPVLEGDRVLFCSDGLFGPMGEEDLHELMSLDDFDEYASHLSALANEHGGHDNISLVLAQVVSQSGELDAAEPQPAGSALEREIPTIAHEEEGPGYPELGPAEDPDHDSTEQAHHAPRESKNERHWSTILAAILAGAIVMGVTFWGVRVYSSSRYFIAAAGGQVEIYNGLPGSLPGHEMNTLIERRDTRISGLPMFFRRQVADTIRFSSLTSARDAAKTLDGYAIRYARTRQQRLGPVKQPGRSQPSEPEGPGLPMEPVATASLSSSPGGQTNYPIMLSPMSPTTAEEVDPGAC